ncbi:cleavage stimulation factor subunit 3 [Tetranychus urticae]|uniref:Suppressor of forked domain-containing protein n=1 Tax=Tetranychus urticae TaxID=32264 RepID=T1K8U1_TETUR|nr:cleavage stimulation factor subunit 3 [Tetranychus urticae]XP_015784484.1 cleavage stimulation factor subunit 3 [Tetranychus urticae]
MSERGQKAEARLQENPWDTEAWQILIKEYGAKKLEEARPFYERLVTQFPLTGRYWKLYIDHEMKSRNYDKVEKLFQRCLIKVLHIDLWRCYLNYIKETKAPHPSFREKMAQAYDFALDKIGIDNHSYPIWNDYVSFLKNVEAVGSYAENQKITAVRRVYQRGVINPMMNIDQFWRDYIAYEQSINQMIAEKMIADRSRDYMNARRVAKEYEAITRGLNRNAPSLPPSCRPEDLKQVDIWRKYIAWEKSNPLRSEDPGLVIKRVVFAYETCLLCLGHYPDIWYEYAAYLEENSKMMSDKGDMNQFKSLQEDSSAVYERAISTLLKTSLLIHFAYADFEEGRNNKNKAVEIYNRLLDIKDDKLDPTLVYIQFMKFSRRSEGIKAARNVFKRAREDPRCGHQVFTCAALMEYYCSKDKNVACKIFELGLKRYGNNANYISSYIDFLSAQNEENNARVLFERVLTSNALDPADSLQIWNRFLTFESNIGDLSSVIKVEKRRAIIIQEITKVSSETAYLVDRYKFQDLMPCSTHELKSIGYQFKSSLPNGLSQTLGNLLGPAAAAAASINNVPAPVNSNSPTNNIEPSSSNQVTPDLNQMIPYKPVLTSVLIPGSHSVPGGIFPPPPAVGQLLAQLPHPSSFHGPFVIVDELMNLIRNTNKIDISIEKPNYKPDQNNHHNIKLFETAIQASKTFNPIMSNSSQEKGGGGGGSGSGGPGGPGGMKRIIGHDDDEEDPENDNSNPANPPAFDIYRTRQLQKRVK